MRLWDWVDFVLAGIVGLLVLFLVAVIAGAAYQFHWESTHTCVRSHPERQSAWVQYVLVGKVLVPIFHAERDVNVCDEWGPK